MKFFHRFELETTSLACFRSNCLSYLAKEIFFQKLPTLFIAKFTTSRRIDITLQIRVKQLRASTICSAFTPDSRYDNNIIKLIGNVYCANTVRSGTLCVHRKTFNLSAEKTINGVNPRPSVRCATFPVKNKRICFS